MPLQDSSRTYGPVSRVNHWGGALLVVVLLFLGLAFDNLPKGLERSTFRSLHIAVGTLALPLLMFRVLWRVRSGAPAPLPQPALLQMLSKLVHVLLLVGIVAMLITGPLIVWSGGKPFGISGVIQVPSPFPPFKAWKEPLELVHTALAWGLIGLVVLHVAGVLKHHLVDRDGTLARMTGRG